MQTQVQKEFIENAIERAKLFGMLNYLPDGNLTHTPFSLSPYSISNSELNEMIDLTTHFSELMINVSQNWDFLEEHLKPIAKNDHFIRILLDLRKKEVTQNKQLLIQRNDFFLVNDEQINYNKTNNKGFEDSSESILRQVEINTVSVSFPFLITQLARLHKYFYEQNKLKAIIKNNPIKHVVDAFANALEAYDAKSSIILLVAQSKENNLFDQIGLEQLLWDYHKIKTVRKSLSEIYEICRLKDGHLILEGEIVALTYYRAGYSPDDFIEDEAIKGRQLIEASSTIQVPNLSIQLAGMKKIQQLLTKPEIISKFVSPEISKLILKTFVKFHTLDEIIDTPRGNVSASEWVSLNPHEYVLKPQREGGGNNFFGKEITNILSKIQKSNFNTYVLMENINAKTHPAILVVDGKAENLSCISEVGRYGICTAENGKVINNNDIGYLVRTKSENVKEGGVCAGFACLNSLTIN